MNNTNTQKHVFIGMSGGVDSSASVKILLDQKYKVTGVTFVGLGKEEQKFQTGKSAFIGKSSSRKCCSAEEVIVAKQVCFHLGIDHITLDLAEVFKKMVRDPFLNSYLKGETPNPCMLCNRFVKLGALVDFALKNGADYVAMGHYTGVELVAGEYLLKAGKDKNKDQSYFLALLKPEILPYLIFPLADKEKDEVRAIVDASPLPLKGDKVESQDICFVDDDYRDYLKLQGVPKNEGEMTLDNKIVGTHEGVPFYSLGQRRGLGIAVGKKVFIREIDATNNKITLGEKPTSTEFTVSDLNIFSSKLQDGEWDIQTRYRSPRVRGTIKFIDKDTISVTLSEAQEIVTPGQYAVFYKDDYIYGAGKITTTKLLD